jgi:methionyl-tRNA formyltransferase
MDKLNVAFFGSPEFAVPCLQLLLLETDVRVVVTQPDKPAGRGRHLAAPPVKEVAIRAGLPILQPPSLRKPLFVDELKKFLPLDLAVVIAYGKILPPDLLTVPKHGCWNVHGSILPKYRGAAPIQRALMAGEAETGVTLMQMDAGMDTGPTFLVHKIPVTDEDTSGTMHEKLSLLGAAALAEGLALLAAGTLRGTVQHDSLATAAPMLEKEEGRIDWSQPARAVRDRVRAVDPWPGAFTVLDGEIVKCWGAKILSGSGAPGVVLGADREGLWVGCGEGVVALAELQLPGRKRMEARALLAGRPIPPGTKLG